MSDFPAFSNDAESEQLAIQRHLSKVVTYLRSNGLPWSWDLVSSQVSTAEPDKVTMLIEWRRVNLKAK